MNFSMKDHIRNMYRMKWEYPYTEKNNFNKKVKNKLTYKILDIQSAAEFLNPDNVPIQKIVSSNQNKTIGAYLDDKPVAFATIVKRGNREDYFNVKNSDVYLQNLYTFPEYRGRGIMRDLILRCIYVSLTTLKFSGCMTKGKISVSLCVRTDNNSAIKCYKRLGFKGVGRSFFIRVKGDIIFPRQTI